MNQTLQALLSLQDTDRQIYRLRAELQRLPQELKIRHKKLSDMVTMAKQYRAEAQHLRSQVKEVEDSVTILRMRQRKLEKECNSVGVDAALLASYQHEIRTVKDTISEAEDDGLNMLAEADEKQVQAEQLEATVVAERPDFDALSAAVKAELTEATAKLEALDAQRTNLQSATIPEDQLNLYKGLLERREGEALAELTDLICQGCFVLIPRNLYVRLARGVDLVQCPSCTRILYVR
jgi:predicted  nucleic acid-binding Zn-ribbon protein